MRITGGAARGIPLTAPKGRDTRPATDQLREAVFSSLGSRIEGARVADLFAGTGAYGLEAMSRGAASGCFVENSREVVACLKKNLAAALKSCGTKPSDWHVLAQKVDRVSKNLGPFEIVFMDPPYAMIEESIPGIFVQHIAEILTPDGLACIEMPGNLEINLPGWAAKRRLGKAGKDKPTMVFYERG
ncbi:methyltransferase [Coraliomargarita sinensis]|uniref:Methyltransferase n=2 Tax=Coraliomargarita sinensis TaxID=2174842 RepID=A0A317ZHV1_9BACT|nr:methyltransferase [Coraliomargarita sinensis]